MLYAALIFVILILILEKFVNSKTDPKEETTQTNIDGFSKKDYLLTQNELKLYKLIKPITNKLELNLFCQVSMYELINCKDYKQFNRIKSKSIDFVITEKNCKIKLCIELDDDTHQQQKRIERDNLVNEIFKTANTKLIRIPVKNFYDIEKLENLIKESL